LHWCSIYKTVKACSLSRSEMDLSHSLSAPPLPLSSSLSISLSLPLPLYIYYIYIYSYKCIYIWHASDASNPSAPGVVWDVGLSLVHHMLQIHQGNPHTLHSSLYTLHSTFYTLPSPLYTLHSPLSTLHSHPLPRGGVGRGAISGAPHATNTPRQPSAHNQIDQGSPQPTYCKYTKAAPYLEPWCICSPRCRAKSPLPCPPPAANTPRQCPCPTGVIVRAV